MTRSPAKDDFFSERHDRDRMRLGSQSLTPRRKGAKKSKNPNLELRNSRKDKNLGRFCEIAFLSS
jgi:hypothetical protein